MDMMLSNVGHRRVMHLGRAPQEQDATFAVLADIIRRGAQDAAEIPGCDALREQGLIQPVPAGMDIAAIRLRYGRNPLENISRVVFEYTTLCNLSCKHCRNGSLSPVTIKDLAALKRVVDVVVPLGIRRFDFIGGEVLLYGMRWPELVGHIRSRPGTTVSMLSSGWFFGQERFWAAGKRYADDVAFLAAVAEAGVTHLTFSLDGPQPVHDLCREVEGLYGRIMAGLPRVREAGLTPQVSMVFFPGITDRQRSAWMTQLAGQLYPGLSTRAGLTRLQEDPMNYASNFIDVGNGSGLVSGGADADQIPDRVLRCKNFYRPAPTLRFKASGELSLCPLIDAGDGYGNVRRADPLDVLNGMQDAFVFRLHAEERIADYRPLVDEALFGGPVTHVCSMRVILTMLAQAIFEAGYDHTTVPADVLAAINRRVAQRVGQLPSEGPGPLGRKPPA